MSDAQIFCDHHQRIRRDAVVLRRRSPRDDRWKAILHVRQLQNGRRQ